MLLFSYGLRLFIVFVVGVLVVDVLVELRKLTNNLADVTPSLILCESCTCRRSLYCSVPTNSLRKHLEELKKELLKLKSGGGSWLIPHAPQKVQRWLDLKSSYKH